MPLMHAGTGDGVIGAIMHDLGVEDEASLTQVAINMWEGRIRVRCG